MSKLVLWTALLLGVVLIGNGSFMLLAPESWYWAIKGVAERGPFNQHFIRDVGIVYMICGCAFAVGGLYVEQRVSLWMPAAAFIAGHGLFHFWEVAVGICGPQSLMDDFAGVTVPGLLAIALVTYAWRNRHSDRAEVISTS